MLNFLMDIVKIGLLVGYIALDFKIVLFILQQGCIVGMKFIL